MHYHHLPHYITVQNIYLQLNIMEYLEQTFHPNIQLKLILLLNVKVQKFQLLFLYLLLRSFLYMCLPLFLLVFQMYNLQLLKLLNHLMFQLQNLLYQSITNDFVSSQHILYHIFSHDLSVLLMPFLLSSIIHSYSFLSRFSTNQTLLTNTVPSSIWAENRFHS